MDNSPATGRNSMSEELTVIEEQNLVELEDTIRKNLTAFYEVGFALMQIRDNRLYRKEYGTFEEYCKEKWGMERRHAYRLIDGYKVTENVSHGTQGIPTSERVVRPLTIIKDPDEQREVYQKAVETAPEGKITAKHVEKTVSEYKHTETHVVSDAMAFSTMAISQLERINKDDPKMEEALLKVEGWAAHRRASLRDKKKSKRKSNGLTPPKISERFHKAFEVMADEIKKENLNGWKDTDREDGRRLLRNLPELVANTAVNLIRR